MRIIINRNIEWFHVYLCLILAVNWKIKVKIYYKFKSYTPGQTTLSNGFFFRLSKNCEAIIKNLKSGNTIKARK